MSKKDNPGKKFLSNFLNKPYGSKSFLGINLPEFGFSEKFDTNVPQPAPTTTPTDPNKTQLGDAFKIAGVDLIYTVTADATVSSLIAAALREMGT